MGLGAHTWTLRCNRLLPFRGSGGHCVPTINTHWESHTLCVSVALFYAIFRSIPGVFEGSKRKIADQKTVGERVSQNDVHFLRGL